MSTSRLLPDVDAAIHMIQLKNGSAASVGESSAGTPQSITSTAHKVCFVNNGKLLASASCDVSTPASVSSTSAVDGTSSAVYRSADVARLASALPPRLPKESANANTRKRKYSARERRLMRVLSVVVGEEAAQKAVGRMAKKQRLVVSLSEEIADLREESAEIARELQRAALARRHAEERFKLLQQSMLDTQKAFEKFQKDKHDCTVSLDKLEQRRAHAQKVVTEYKDLVESAIHEADKSGDLKKDLHELSSTESGDNEKDEKIDDVNSHSPMSDETPKDGVGPSSSSSSSSSSLSVFTASSKWPTWVYRVTVAQRLTLQSMTDCRSCLFVYGSAHKNDDGCKRAQAYRKKIKSVIVTQLHKEQRQKLIKEYADGLNQGYSKTNSNLAAPEQSRVVGQKNV